jgi:hypothetical protein
VTLIELAGAIGLPTLALFAWIRRGLGPGGARLLLAAGLAVGLGLGVSAAVFCVWRLAVRDLRPAAFHALDIAVWVLVMAAAWRVPSSTASRRSDASDDIDWWLVGAIAIVGGLSVTYFVVRTTVAPNGDWDAWAIWNLKARFMVRGGAAWTNLFSSALTQHDYPFLLSAAVARLWLWTGDTTPHASAAVAAVFTYAIPAVVTGTLARLRGWTPALWGGLLTLAAWPLTVFGAAQMADVPLAFLVLASVVLLVLDAQSDDGVRLATLAGIAAGLTSLMKDEGMPFVLIMAAAYLTYWGVQRSRPVGQRVRHLLAWVGGGLPFWGLLAAMKTHTSAGGLATALTDAHAASKVLNLARHEQIIHAFVVTMWSWGGSFPIGVVPVFAAVLVVGGCRVPSGLRSAVGFSTVVVLGMLASFYAAYVLSPYDLTWHLATSLQRILVQVWPTFVLAFCLVAPLDARIRRRLNVASRPTPPA